MNRFLRSLCQDESGATAIEYGFYVFFSLCLFATVAALLVERLRTDHAAWSHRISLVSRVAYALAVVATITVYAVQYGSRLV